MSGLPSLPSGGGPPLPAAGALLAFAGSLFTEPVISGPSKSASCGLTLGAADGAGTAPLPSGKLNICCAQDKADPAGAVASGIGRTTETSPSAGSALLPAKK